MVSLKFRIQCLPAWQIQSAPSPRCPRDDQHFPATKIGEMDNPAFAIGYRKVRRDSRLQKSAAQRRDFAETPDARIAIDNNGLTELMGEGGEVEVFAARHILR